MSHSENLYWSSDKKKTQNIHKSIGFLSENFRLSTHKKTAGRIEKRVEWNVGWVQSDSAMFSFTQNLNIWRI